MNHPQLAVSTWSLHRSLEAGNATLLDIPAQAAAHGIRNLEICHFHFPSTESAYLAELQNAFESAGVTFLTLLIDDFDLTHPDPAQRERAINMVLHWIYIAGACGAEGARVIAGKQPPTDETLSQSTQAFQDLLHRADDAGTRLVTENWHNLLDQPGDVLSLLDRLEGRLGLMLDFGNWKGNRKYADLAQIAGCATSTHAKADFSQVGEMDHEDFTRCLSICRDAGFSGPHSLIFDGPISAVHTEWDSLDQMQEVATPYLAG